MYMQHRTGSPRVREGVRSGTRYVKEGERERESLVEIQRKGLEWVRRLVRIWSAERVKNEDGVK